jgi:hypothetical protein
VDGKTSENIIVRLKKLMAFSGKRLGKVVAFSL